MHARVDIDAFHGIDAVADQVQQDLLQFDAITVDRRHVGSYDVINRDVARLQARPCQRPRRHE